MDLALCFRRQSAAWVSATLLPFTLVVPAWAHAHLLQSEPAAGATLDAAPGVVRLKFSEPLEPVASGITLVAASGSPITTAKASADLSDATVLTLALPPLAGGRYAVRWSVVSHDGHRVKGEVSFSVK